MLIDYNVVIFCCDFGYKYIFRNHVMNNEDNYYDYQSFTGF